jgi:hypothetical protein
MLNYKIYPYIGEFFDAFSTVQLLAEKDPLAVSLYIL